jgi:transposase
MEKEGELAFPGNGIEPLSSDQKRIRDLEKQLADVEMDREILKKALENSMDQCNTNNFPI